MKASRTVETVLHLAGFKNVKSKVLGRIYIVMWIQELDYFINYSYSKQVVGSRNPHNTVKALFKALNAVSRAFLVHCHHSSFFIFTLIDLPFFSFVFLDTDRNSQGCPRKVWSNCC